MNNDITNIQRRLALNPADAEARRILARLQGRSDKQPEPEHPKLLTYVQKDEGGYFLWRGDRTTKDVPKEAGFLFHSEKSRCNYEQKFGRPCGACKEGIEWSWWTRKEANANLVSQYADARALEALADHQSTVAASRASGGTRTLPVPAGLSYMGYQNAGIEFALEREGVLIADQMGLGKTIQALGVINSDDSIKTVLCIVPASLRLNWEREAKKWLVRDFNFHVMEDMKAPPLDANFIITNYAKLAGTGSKALHAALMSRKWDILILDEAHYVKNPKSNRSKAILGYWNKSTSSNVPGLVHQARRKVFLTGTPILNRPIEAQPLLGALAPREFGHFMRFAKRYAEAHHNGYGWDFKGASNLSELNERARSTVMVRRLKDEVLTDLPPKVRQIITIPANDSSNVVKKEQEAYAQFEATIERLKAEANTARAASKADSGNKELKAAYEAAVEKLQKTRGVVFTEMALIRHEVALAKVPAVIAHVDEMLSSGIDKVILFAHHKDVVAAFESHYSSWKADEFDGPHRNVCVKVVGGMSAQDKQTSVDRFQNEPGVRVFLGNLKAAGVGITLTASSTVVFAELDWVPGIISQAEDRPHRFGQKNSVLVQHLVLDGSLDSRLAEEIISKQEIADQALDNNTRVQTQCPTPKEVKPIPGTEPVEVPDPLAKPGMVRITDDAFSLNEVPF